MKESIGKVFLVGAGPGDPGLITQKGINLLKKCDVVIYDRLVSSRLLNYLKEGCEKIYVGKAVGNHSIKQEEINQIIVEKALTHQVVVRLKGGDPFVFGRGGEEVLTLREHGIPYEVIPGVTSAIAAVTYAGVPITHRGISQSFHVITGHTAEGLNDIPEDFKVLAKLKGTLVILMGLRNLSRIKEELLANGKSIHTPVTVISNGTTLWQKEVRGTLEDICQKVKDKEIKAPAIIVVGEVAELDLRSPIGSVLTGIKVGVTGTKAITDKLSEYLEELGAQVEIVSASEIIEYENNSAFDNALKTLEQYQWIVFTSTNAVNIYFNKMKELRIDLRRMAHIKVAAVGSGTGKVLSQHGILADFIPKHYTVSNLANELCSFISDDERLLIPRAAQGSEELIEILNRNKKSYEDITIYDIKESNGFHSDIKESNDELSDIKEDNGYLSNNKECNGYLSYIKEDNKYLPEIRESNNYLLDMKEKISQFDYITFASSSGVHSFFRGWTKNPKELLGNAKAVCIGEATEATLRDFGYTDAYIAKEASVKGLAERICEIQQYECQEQQNGGEI